MTPNYYLDIESDFFRTLITTSHKDDLSTSTQDRRWAYFGDDRVRPNHKDDKSVYYDNLYYPGLHALNLAMYENIYSSMRMCKKLREFLKPVTPVNDLRNSACYPMGIPERKLPWSDNVIDILFTKDEVIEKINRRYRQHQFNINSQYGRFGR